MTQDTVNLLFLKYCLGNEVNMSGVVAGMDWRQLFAFASKQTILGVCFDGIERLGMEYPSALKDNPIEPDLLMTWMGKAQQIRRQNMRVNAVAGKLYRQMRGDGLRCCILKGQGNAVMYPNPYSRNPGDIDVWVNASRAQIIEYAKGHFELGDDIRYHHLETSVDGVSVELHFFPCVMNNAIYNRRLQKWFERNGDLQCSNIMSLPDGAGGIAVPNFSFNVIYQLCHLYHHFFDEGIGMRQIIDYYYVIKSLPQKARKAQKEGRLFGEEGANTESTEYTDNSFSTTNSTNYTKQRSTAEGKVNKANAMQDLESSENIREIREIRGSSKNTDISALRQNLKRLGLWKFAGAVMWVLHEVLGLPSEQMIVPMDEKRGKLLLAEILDGGNFGKHFSKYGHFTQQGMARKYFLKIWRNMHFVRYYPAEALSEPIFRTWHFFWRVSRR